MSLKLCTAVPLLARTHKLMCVGGKHIYPGFLISVSQQYAIVSMYPGELYFVQESYTFPGTLDFTFYFRLCCCKGLFTAISFLET
jgi:hypothetical protein